MHIKPLAGFWAGEPANKIGGLNRDCRVAEFILSEMKARNDSNRVGDKLPTPPDWCEISHPTFSYFLHAQAYLSMPPVCSGESLKVVGEAV